MKELFTITVNDLRAKKFALYVQVIVVTELLVRET